MVNTELNRPLGIFISSEFGLNDAYTKSAKQKTIVTARNMSTIFANMDKGFIFFIVFILQIFD